MTQTRVRDTMAKKDDYAPRVPGVGKIGTVGKAIGVLGGMTLLVGAGAFGRWAVNKMKQTGQQATSGNSLGLPIAGDFA